LPGRRGSGVTRQFISMDRYSGNSIYLSSQDQHDSSLRYSQASGLPKEAAIAEVFVLPQHEIADDTFALT
jgi:hypothetical protein